MTVTVQQEDLKRIGRYLQEQLKPQAQVTPLQVQCAVKETLLVLVQHPPGNAPDPQQVFNRLEAAIANLPPNLLTALPSHLHNDPIKLFLRVLGQQQPYAFHHVAFPQPNPFRVADTFEMLDPSLELDSPNTVIQSPQPAVQPASSPTSPVAPASPLSDQSNQSNLNQLKAERDRGGELVHAATVDGEDKAPSDASALSEDVAPRPVASPEQRRSLTQPLLLAMGGMAAAIVVGLGGYALTRPCVVGSCTALETAQSLSQQAAATLKTGEPEAAQQATQQLTEARQLVAAIPAWSSQYGKAQSLQQQLDQVLAAESQAVEATQKGQTTTQSVADWQATQDQWRGAIAQLEQVTPESPLHNFAQARLNAYRGNLAFTGQRIAVEQDAQKRLTTAQKTAELAIARQNVAQKLSDWQQAQSTWQVAVNTLQQIPSGTTAHAEAQQLLASYRPKLAASRDRATKEQLAQKIYTQATNYEKQAKTSQQRNQWSQAAASWQNALNAAKQVPEGTSITAEAQALVTNYTGSLQQAQTVVKIRGDLDRVCLAAGRICDYTITNEAIQVKFVPAYERKVRNLGGISQFSGDYETMYRVNAHLASLGNALQAVSNNAGIPVQVYNSDNQLLGAFVPGG
ncbi:MAG: hypothetical protein NW220_11005 [Leptolyngbyaceae cyanobacterium bins.349]|nr:hypothetical protein [Leptolyngbyaceae cyanobacterium bins.349]